MKIYEYNQDGFLVSMIESSEELVVSENQTLKEPPFEDGKIPKWNGEEWELIDRQEEIVREEEIDLENPLSKIEKQLKALELQSEQTEAVLQEMIISGM